MRFDLDILKTFQQNQQSQVHLSLKNYGGIGMISIDATLLDTHSARKRLHVPSLLQLLDFLTG